MKQHITPKQLNELSEKGVNGLASWWLKKAGGDLDNKFPDQLVHIKTIAVPLLSIGQMIEFLEEKLSMSIGEWFPFPERRGRLCDALWEAVKEVLEK